MVMFALDPQEVQDGYDSAQKSGFVPSPDTGPGWTDGAYGSVWQGLEAATAGTALLVGDVQSQVAGAEPSPEEQASRQRFVNVIQQSRPDPKVTGWLGNAVYGLTSVIPQAVLGTLAAGPVGGAALVGTAQGNASASLLKAEGVDDETAETVGTIEGIAQGAGFALPGAIPGRLATRVTSGAGINVGFGMAQRGVTGTVLENAGYHDMADQYRVLDGMGVLTDAGLGAFGGLLHGASPEARTKPDPLSSQTDAALAANGVRH